MAQQYNMLQMGGEDYTVHFEDRKDVKWTYIPFNSIADLEALEQQTEEAEAFDFVFVQSPYSETLMRAFRLVSTPYNTYVDAHYWNGAFEAEPIVRERMIRPFHYESKADCLTRLRSLAFIKQYGDRIHPKQCEVNPAFEGDVYYKGQHTIVLTGDFGETYTPILNWKMYLYYDKDKVNTIWPEYTATGDVEISYTLRLYKEPTMKKLMCQYVLEGSSLQQPLEIPSMPHDAHILITAQAKGRGTLSVGNIHKRWSRLEYGHAILGGQRYVDEDRGEFLHYFHPGDLKPPLNVYFSGYRTAEGFEGYFMMEKLNAPFLLFTDLRYEGGGFYLGSDAFESRIKTVIQETLDWLGFEDDALILSGLSMGSFGALYYGAQLNPTAIVVGKPLVNMGSIAKNMRLMRPNDFGTAIDILRGNEGSIDDEAVTRLNQKFWSVLNGANIENTIFAVSYMENDDYDIQAFSDLLPVLSRQGARVMSRSIPGRHNDDTPTIASWFNHFYYMIMESEFGRVKHERKASI
ncbi:accessory Sec system protein Asp2 [Staphylococcus delphini]|uniref:accessory Sec system protein Asp2 n=1 Tax=Staphylococcus delphini TaxID=53344 RepID=UPI001362374E|nr:accessory Sec system protein Asp2 [Staphylococcus delphini]NBK46716.1 accessory Sec system protein Asp2 [Staphylococcus delphini]